MVSSWMENPTDKDRLLLKTPSMLAVSGVRITQLHYYRVRQVEPCHQALSLSNLALGAMPKQQQQ